MRGGRGKAGITPGVGRLLRRGRRLVSAGLRLGRPRPHVQPTVYHVWASVRPHAWARLYLLLGPARHPHPPTPRQQLHPQVRSSSTPKGSSSGSVVPADGFLVMFNVFLLYYNLNLFFLEKIFFIIIVK